MGNRWKRRRRLHDRWFNRLEKATKTGRNLDEMLRRVLEDPTEKGQTCQHCSPQLDSVPVFNQNSSQLNAKRELLVDVFEDGPNVLVLAELLGVDRSAIDVHATEEKIMVSVDCAERKYDRQIELPARVDVGSSSSSWRNGILEIRFKKLSEKPVLR